MPVKSKPMATVTITPEPTRKHATQVRAIFNGNTEASVALTPSQLTKIFKLAERQLVRWAHENKARAKISGGKLHNNAQHLGFFYGPIYTKLRQLRRSKKNNAVR